MGRSRVSSYNLDEGLENDEWIKESFELLDLKEGVEIFSSLSDDSLKKNEPPKVYLRRLLDAVLLAKEESRIIRWIQQAKFKEVYTLEDFDFSFQPELKNRYERLIKDLASCEFIEKGHNVIFIGPPGIGKTHLSIALAVKGIEKGYSARFIKLKDLISVVHKIEDNPDSFRRILRSFINPDLFILDDVMFYKTDEETASFLHKVLCTRHTENKSTIISSNYGVQDWKSLFLTSVRASTVVDRLSHKGSALIFMERGISYRTGVELGLRK